MPSKRGDKISMMVREFLSSSPLPREVLLNSIEAQGGNRISASHITSRMVKNGEIIRSKEKGQRVVFSLPESPRAEPSGQGAKRTPPEADFYESFAKYLLYGQDDGDDNRLRECTKAIKLGGGSSARGKWATPDVVGILKSREDDPVKFPTEIVSAEIKNDTSLSQLIEGFGQACAYRLFSHKTYLVIPVAGKSERIKTLCHIFGIGLVCFNPAEEPSPSMFAVELLAQRHSPDPFYAKEFFNDETLKKNLL